MTKSVLLTLCKAALAAIAGFSYASGFGFLALLYGGFGHGDKTPLQILSIPWGVGIGFVPFVCALLPFSRSKFAAALGAGLMLTYFLGAWIEDLAGFVKRFSSTKGSDVFVFAFCCHLSLSLFAFCFFVWRLKRKKASSKSDVS